VALIETSEDGFDLLDIPLGEPAPGDRDHFDSLAIEIADDAQIDDEDGHPEPSLAASPFFIEFDEPVRLDPERAGLTWELPPAVREWAMRWSSPLVAVALHLLPVVAVILLPLLMIEPPPPIPVQLVFEEPPPPPPPPPPQPQPQPKPQPKFQQPKMETGRLASVDMGAVKPQQELGRTPDPVASPSAGEQRPDPSDTQTATTTPPPPIPLPKPSPPNRPSSVQLPKPSGAHVPHREEVPHEQAHTARYAGMASTRDEYLAYLVSLTRQHMDLLPLSFIGDRRGEAIISVTVYDNGGIGPVGIIHSSGYPDIDKRIEEMVLAVHKFPPLPQWYQGNAVQLEMTLRFPEAVERSE
jgi:TonB family protein